MSKREILAAGLCMASAGAFGALRSVTPAAWDGGKPNGYEAKDEMSAAYALANPFSR